MLDRGVHEAAREDDVRDVADGPAVGCAGGADDGALRDGEEGRG